jgi:hypothetical protein
MNSRYRRAAASLPVGQRGNNLALRISILSLVACLLAACSKPVRPDRYDRAIDLAKSYSIQQLPASLARMFTANRVGNDEYFTDIALHPSFNGKFEAAATELDKLSYFQPDNRSLLEGIIADTKSTCVVSAPSAEGNVDCGDNSLQYAAEDIRLLHTQNGDFIFSSADMYRGNGKESNENASPVVVVIDLTDGGLGLILEDHIATRGGRREVLATALTLASSIVRLENESVGKSKVQADAISYDLEAAKTGTLFVKPRDNATDTPALPSPPQSSSGPEDTSAGRGKPNQDAIPSITSYSKEEFKNLVMGKTMAEVRSALGEPSNTIDSPDYLIWYYWSDKIQVVDSDAGLTVQSAGVLFNPFFKTAVGVTF